MRPVSVDSMAALDRAVGTGYDFTCQIEVLHELKSILDVINSELIMKQQHSVAEIASLRAEHPRIVDYVTAKRDAIFAW